MFNRVLNTPLTLTLHKKIKFSIKDFFSKCDQIRIWSHLKKSLTENFFFCVLRFPNNKYELSVESSCLWDWNGLNWFWVLLGYPFCAFCITLKIIGSLNSLSANTTKWPNTLKPFVGCCLQIVWVYLTILWGWHLQG